MKKYDYIIIGAGPAGISTALEIKCRDSSAQVLLLEKNDSIGRKLRASGNGKCNISNTKAEHSSEVLDFLKRNGLAVRICDNGLVYPYSESAGDVVALFEKRLHEEGVELNCNSTVEAVECVEGEEGGFAVTVTDTSVGASTSPGATAKSHSQANAQSREPARKTTRFFSNKVVLSCGGKAGPQFGTIGDGYRFARKLGHSIVSAVPVLSSVECDGQDCEKIAGIRAKGRVKLFFVDGADYREVFSEDGEIQFTKYGLSGICIFNMTRFMRFDRYRSDSGCEIGFPSFRILIDLFPDRDMAEYEFEGVLRKGLAEYVKAHGNDIHRLEFRPTGIKGWKDAQCTSGGVSLGEIDSANCESKLVPGLYIAGELADYDGACGGYNINNAIYTGLKIAGAGAK